MHTNIQNNPYYYRQQTKQAYVAYLDTLPWDFFITGSTRYDLTLKSVRRLVERWYDRIKLMNESMLFWVAEPFELKDGHHMHGLLRMPACSKQYFNLMVDYWQWATGNNEGLKHKWNALHLVNYNPKQGASGYCAKYIMKDHSDYDLLCW